jgi:hypothetical protein
VPRTIVACLIFQTQLLREIGGVGAFTQYGEGGRVAQELGFKPDRDSPRGSNPIAMRLCANTSSIFSKVGSVMAKAQSS